MRTHPVDKLLEQHCYKSAAGLLQLARFYVCTKIPLACVSTLYFLAPFPGFFVEAVFTFKNFTSEEICFLGAKKRL